MNTESSPLQPYFIYVAFAVLLVTSPGFATAQASPERVSVLPVFVVPAGQRNPSRSDQALLMKHLQWAQARYREMLGNRSTFDLEIKPHVFQSKRSLAQFEEGNAANLVVPELLDSMGMDRFSCNHVFVAVFVNPNTGYPGGGGRPINGGINTGGGIVVISTHALKKSKNFQSTLQHELGHSFGLTHVDAYGYDMRQNDSIMSYNKSHHTSGLNPSRSPGTLIPEDIRGLALNDRVFPDLEFDERQDLPAGYEMQSIRHLGPMKLPSHPLVQVETSDGETNRSSVGNIVHSRIKPSIDRGKIEYDWKTMWHSASQKDGIASIRLTLPMPVTLDRIKIYSQHSGKHHEVKGVRASTVSAKTKRLEVFNGEIGAPDGEIQFEPATSQHWEFEFQTGKSKTVVIRGLRFFNGNQELFPQLVPHEAEQ